MMNKEKIDYCVEVYIRNSSLSLVCQCPDSYTIELGCVSWLHRLWIYSRGRLKLITLPILSQAIHCSIKDSGWLTESYVTGPIVSPILMTTSARELIEVLREVHDSYTRGSDFTTPASDLYRGKLNSVLHVICDLNGVVNEI